MSWAVSINMIDTPESFVTFFQTKQITKRKEVLLFGKTEYRNESGERSHMRHDCRTTHALCRVTDYTVRGVFNIKKVYIPHKTVIRLLKRFLKEYKK